MRDAATAAAMSDPDQNRWFRRRWVEPAWLAHIVHQQPELTGPADDPDDLGFDHLARDLLSDFRRGRCDREVAVP